MAKFIPEDFIEEVRMQNDIVDVVSEYLVLKPSGKGFFALCPFHSEKTASFHVYPEKQIYHCFGCGIGGNVFSFIMAIENIGFVDAVKMLAERVGLHIPETYDSSKYDEIRAYNENLYNINTQAARYYHKILMSKEGQSALKYLKSRGLDMRTIKVFGLGFAPEGWDNIKNHLIAQGFEEELLIESGIIVEKDGNVYDRFRNRIMFPIINQSGYVVGFGGRVMDDSLPKYLNTSESPVFNKSRVLFGLNIAKKKRPLTNIIIVEGYMDVISLYRYGYHNVVASLGTALTSEQASLIRRYAGEAIIAYDGDTAGQQATLRGIEVLTKAGCDVKVAKFPDGLDPDDVLKEYGKDYFDKLLDRAVSAVDFKLDILRQDFDLTSEEGRVEYATEAAKILAEVDNILKRDVHIRRMEEITGFKAELIYRQIAMIKSKNNKTSVKRNDIGNNRHISVAISGKIESSQIAAERGLINLMAQNESIAREVLDRLGKYRFQLDIHQEIVDIIERILKTNKELNIAQIFNYVHDGKKIQQMVEIFNIQNEYDNMSKYIDDCINQLEEYRLKNELKDIQTRIAEMEKENSYDVEEHRLLLQKAQELSRRILVLERERRG
ncbi:MAG TPA: DNA primase [Clostridiales bacterium]|nr:DNA primase [Clostridiales bacterium]